MTTASLPASGAPAVGLRDEDHRQAGAAAAEDLHLRAQLARAGHRALPLLDAEDGAVGDVDRPPPFGQERLDAALAVGAVAGHALAERVPGATVVAVEAAGAHAAGALEEDAAHARVGDAEEVPVVARRAAELRARPHAEGLRVRPAGGQAAAAGEGGVERQVAMVEDVDRRGVGDQQLLDGRADGPLALRPRAGAQAVGQRTEGRQLLHPQLTDDGRPLVDLAEHQPHPAAPPGGERDAGVERPRRIDQRGEGELRLDSRDRPLGPGFAPLPAQHAPARERERPRRAALHQPAQQHLRRRALVPEQRRGLGDQLRLVADGVVRMRRTAAAPGRTPPDTVRRGRGSAPRPAARRAAAARVPRRCRAWRRRRYRVTSGAPSRWRAAVAVRAPAARRRRRC